MINKNIILGLWSILLPTSFASLYYAIDSGIFYGLLIGLAIGAIPFALGAREKEFFRPRLFELIILVALFVISLSVALQIMLPLVDQASFALERILPLLATTLALYALYILLSRIISEKETPRLIEQVENVLSGPPVLLTLSIAVIIASYILITIHNLQINNPDLIFFTSKFLDRGIIPPITVVLFCWGLVILASKAFNLWNERSLLPRSEGSLLLSAYHETTKKESGTKQGPGIPNDSSRSMYMDLLWKKSTDFYILPRYINWAIPILGFIGTVFGISLAADGVQRIISSQQGLTQISTELSDAIAPLGIAFDTTLIALSLSIVLTLLQTVLHRWESNILTDCENQILQPED